MTFICYPKCSTCKKAQKFLDEHQISYVSRDITVNNPSYEELKMWYKTSQLPLRNFYNTSGLTYRSLGLKDKLNTMDEKEQLNLLASDGMLVKRPLFITKDSVLVGFNETEWAKQLKK